MLSVIKLNVIILNVFMLSVVMLSVVAPPHFQFRFKSFKLIHEQMISTAAAYFTATPFLL